MLSKVDIGTGQVSGVSDLSEAASSVVNFDVDDAGVNLPRPGLTAYPVTGLRAAAVTGLERWGNRLIVAFSDGYWAALIGADLATVVDISDATTDSQLYGGRRPTFVPGTDLIFAASGDRIRYWHPSLAVAGYLYNSPLCTHIASIGRRLIANDLDQPQSFWWSDIGEGAWASWPSGNQSSAEARPDPIAAIAENVNELFVWGTETLQVYQLGVDPTLPFDLVATMNTGLGAPYCFVRLDENFAFLDDKRRIVISDGRGVETISDAIQLDLRSLLTISDAFAYREEIGQYSYAVFRFPTERRTFVYDLKAKRWHERKYYASPFQADYPVGAAVYWPALNYHIVGSNLPAGGLYRLDKDSRRDIGGPLVCERVTGWSSHKLDGYKRSAKVRAIMRRGTSSVSTVADQGAIELRVQDDDKPWSEWDNFPVGSASQFETNRDAFLGGIFQRRRYHVRYSSTDSTALAELHDDVEELVT